MRVLFVSSGNIKEGISPIIYNQGNTLIRKGIEIIYFTINGKGLLSYLKHISILNEYLKENRFDLIHAHYGLCGLVAIHGKGKSEKLVISFMGTDLLRTSSSNRKSSPLLYLVFKVIQKSIKQADHIIVKSNLMAGKIKHNNISIIPNGVDLNQFPLLDRFIVIKELGWDQRLIHILFMSDPNRVEKNFTLAENSLNLINNSKIQLHFLKNIPFKDVVNYYIASDVCILSSFHEGSPNVIKEAMICNRPIVSTDVGDVRHLFGDIGGCYIASFEPSDFAEKIQTAIEFGKNKQCTQGRQRILDLCLDSESIAKKLLNVYITVLNSKKSIKMAK